MPGQIFINYRRGDDPGFTQALFARLESAFAADQLFMDIDSIEPGLDFVRVLEEQVDKCDVLLTVIGPNWLEPDDETGSRRLDNPDDFVRIEIESGIRLGKRIIPVLVNGADMPSADHLPESLRPLARRNAVRLTHERFKADVSALIKQLEKALQNAEALRQAEQFAEVRRREAETEARATASQRQQTGLPQGLSSEQIARAEEIANWDFIKDNRNAGEFLDHLKRFPKGVTARMARAKLEGIVWSELEDDPTLEVLENFLATFPDGKHSAEATELYDSLRADTAALLEEEERIKQVEEAWISAKSANSIEAYHLFLSEWPRSQHTKEAWAQMRSLKGEAAPVDSNTVLIILIAIAYISIFEYWRTSAFLCLLLWAFGVAIAAAMLILRWSRPKV